MYRRILKSILMGILLAVLLAGMPGCNLPTGTAMAGFTPTNASAPATVAATVAATIDTAAVTDTTTVTNTTTVTDTATATVQPTVTHLVKPAEPPASFESQIYDMDSSAFAAQHRVEGGDNFATDLFERPFDQSMNTYFPDLDIKQTYLSRDANWTYINISLVGPSSQGGLAGDYGLEIDVNRDGRGEFLIMAAAPGASWSTDRVQVWQDKNGAVGGATPVQSDPLPQTGNGYETVLFNAGQGADPDLAWARVSPTNPASVQIAFKRSLFNDANPYMWGAWAMDASMLHPDWFDNNDHFTLAQAGSPLQGSADYPLKALYKVDNTCRWAVGFTPTGNEPGICPVIQPTATPTPLPTRTPTKVPCILVPGTKICRTIIMTRVPIFPLNTATATTTITASILLNPSTSTGNCGVNKAQTTETIKLQSSAKTTITGIKAEFFNGNLMNSSQLNFPNTTSLTYTDPILSSKGCGTYRFRLTLTSPVNMIVDATWVVSH